MKILVSDKIDDSALDLLQDRGFELEVLIKASPEALASAVKNADGWIIRSGTSIGSDLLETASSLKVIGRAGVGVDNIDVDCATRMGIAVLNTPSGNTMAAVEHTMAMLLALARHIPNAHTSLVARGSWERSQYTGVELSGKTMGILGLGKIGARVATRCQAMEMTVLGYDPFLSTELAKSMGIELVEELDDLLGRCQFISLHLPATEETRGLLNAERLAACKPGIRIVNCARGSLVDEQALLTALKTGHVCGAALDVFETEPPTNAPILKAPNLVATPHLGASTIESQRNVGLQIAEQVADALDSGIFREAVNIPVKDWHTFSRLKPKLVLAEKLGQFAQQYIRGGISKINIEYCGEGFEEIPAINNTLLDGLLKPVSGTTINAVNAPLIAEERGITVSSSESEYSSNYRSLVRLNITGNKKTYSFVGTSFYDGEPRLVEIDGFEVELFLFGIVLVFSNFDRPGVIGDVGTILGENKINVAHFSLGREKTGSEALGIVAVDGKIPRKVIKMLSELPDMQWVKQIVFQ